MDFRFRCHVLLMVVVLFQVSHEEKINADKILLLQHKTEELIQNILIMVRRFFQEKRLLHKCLPEQIPDKIIDILKKSIDCVEGNEKLFDHNKIPKDHYRKNFNACFKIPGKELREVLQNISTNVDYCPDKMKEKTYLINVTTYYTSTFRLNIQNGVESFQKDITKSRNDLFCSKSFIKNGRPIPKNEEHDDNEETKTTKPKLKSEENTQLNEDNAEDKRNENFFTEDEKTVLKSEADDSDDSQISQTTKTVLAELGKGSNKAEINTPDEKSSKTTEKISAEPKKNESDAGKQEKTNTTQKETSSKRAEEEINNQKDGNNITVKGEIIKTNETKVDEPEKSDKRSSNETKMDEKIQKNETVSNVKEKNRKRSVTPWLMKQTPELYKEDNIRRERDAPYMESLNMRKYKRGAGHVPRHGRDTNQEEMISTPATSADTYWTDSDRIHWYPSDQLNVNY